jgi:hypothetical protein
MLNRIKFMVHLPDDCSNAADIDWAPLPEERAAAQEQRDAARVAPVRRAPAKKRHGHAIRKMLAVR